MRTRKEGGFAFLISMLIAATVMLILLGAFLPNIVTANRVADENNAAQWMQSVMAAEMTYSKTFLATVPIANLTGSLASPYAVGGCANPMLIQNITAPPGYTYSLTLTGTAAGFTCANGPTLVGTGYAFTLTPVSAFQAQRNFFTCSGTGCDNQIHFASNTAATETSPVYSTVSSPENGQVGNGTNSGTSVAQPWVQNQSYPAGQMVLWTPSCQGAWPDGGCAPVGGYLNLTGANTTYPPSDPADWQPLSSTNASWTPSPPPNLSGNVTTPTIAPYSFYTTSVGFLGGSFTAGSFTITNLSPIDVNSDTYFDASPTSALAAQQGFYCGLQETTTNCAISNAGVGDQGFTNQGPQTGGATPYPVIYTNTVWISVYNSSPDTRSISFTWTLTPSN